mmetsp:Transcript_34017/g.108466  ORF Transcript_34017/g.108466 Transcript_34017/m.108466 type:complete len:247 (-) Transcript_34017:1637-2377(-)
MRVYGGGRGLLTGKNVARDLRGGRCRRREGQSSEVLAARRELELHKLEPFGVSARLAHQPGRRGAELAQRRDGAFACAAGTAAQLQLDGGGLPAGRLEPLGDFDRVARGERQRRGEERVDPVSSRDGSLVLARPAGGRDLTRDGVPHGEGAVRHADGQLTRAGPARGGGVEGRAIGAQPEERTAGLHAGPHLDVGACVGRPDADPAATQRERNCLAGGRVPLEKGARGLRQRVAQHAPAILGREDE